MSNTFLQGGKNFLGGASPLVTGLVASNFYFRYIGQK